MRTETFLFHYSIIYLQHLVQCLAWIFDKWTNDGIEQGCLITLSIKWYALQYYTGKSIEQYSPWIQASFINFLGLPWTCLVAQTVKNPHPVQETWIQSLGQKEPVEKGKAAHSSILAWRIPWTEEPGSLHSTGHKSQTWLSDQAWAYRITIAPFSFNAPQGFLLAQCCCSVTKPCPTLCYCMDCGMPGSSALPYLLEFA